MNHKGKIIGACVLIVLLTSTVGSVGVIPKISEPQTLGILEYEPRSHDFGDMFEGELNTTIFEIWTSGGCCELSFDLSWNCPWLDAFRQVVFQMGNMFR